MNSIVTNEDCMALMARTPDKFYDLAIVDPPYGIGEARGQNKSRSQNRVDPRNGKPINANGMKYSIKAWDAKTPDAVYFSELFRVSKNQIIWGANFFLDFLPSTPSMIIWDKVNGENDFADVEIAWTNFKRAARLFSFMWAGMRQGSPADGKIMQGNMAKRELRIHPTQKPVALYRWLLKNYAKAGDKILDTHLGSGSSRIAAHEMGFDFTGCELDKDYFEAQEKRFAKYLSQGVLAL